MFVKPTHNEAFQVELTVKYLLTTVKALIGIT